MLLWFIFLIILGLFIQNLVKRRIAPSTNTPAWIFWWILMTPALFLTAWMFLVGPNNPPPRNIVFMLFLLSLVSSLWLMSSSGNSNSLPKVQQLKSSEREIKPIEAGEEARLRNCFPWTIFYLQNLDYKPQAILCRGRLRTNSDEAYKTIKSNIERAFGERFLVLFQDSLKGPFFALIPNPAQLKMENEEPLNRPFFALFLLMMTLFTTTVIGIRLVGVSAIDLKHNLALFKLGLPYSLGLIAILGAHELGHYFTAVRYKIKTTLPYFIPLPFFLGTFGAFIQMRSSVPNRRALFDVAIAGPIAGFVITLPILILGLTLSTTVSESASSNLLDFQSLDPRFSFLLSLLSKLAMGSVLIAGKSIVMHPLAIAGYIGLIITALNLLPVGQLDGGHIVHAMFGQRIAITIGQITRILVFLLALSRSDLLLWAILLFFFPLADQPALNDVSELDNGRDILGFAALVLLVMILLPLPPTVAHWLNI